MANGRLKESVSSTSRRNRSALLTGGDLRSFDTGSGLVSLLNTDVSSSLVAVTLYTNLPISSLTDIELEVAQLKYSSNLIISDSARLEPTKKSSCILLSTTDSAKLHCQRSSIPLVLYFL
ncbi:hypothetical protein H4Q26_015997 [Puccinia striiformis f. sp. tritici PST-130]|nr:hypothetical protein H4Q26_015997 [Puccinia striiformis f. sp. tritici PST-130]